jgi:signal transduction histidine kinase
MEEKKLKNQLACAMQERMFVADELQNEVNQVLASAQLWISVAMKENNMQENKALALAESHLKTAIDQLRQLHYTIASPVEEETENACVNICSLLS